ncbi:bone morphogenetic protein 1-like [Physella acuta]|uniref:bone morphogenetic protein 1-like n=1 Tax=Physella acuta TaxID=109671 RepID=UPI0027DC2972|nr:bone morphogenetic protein 1-like [Physella acuta]
MFISWYIFPVRRFSTFSLYGTTTSCLDNVSIYDGDSTSSPLIVKMCGQKSWPELWPMSIRSTGSKILMTFTSDKSYQSTGFRGGYYVHQCLPFTYGHETCTTNCKCSQNNTQYCNNVNGTCVCKNGWSSENCSQDVDECTTTKQELCPADYKQCRNLPGSYECTCKPGLTVNSVTGACEGSYCTKNCSHVCARVPQNNGTFYTEECYCPDGMKLNGNVCQACSNMTYGKDCSRTCGCDRKTYGSCDPQTAACRCYPGWYSAGCTLDINECLTPFACGFQNSLICVNTPGSFRCECPKGFQKTSTDTCVPLVCNSAYTNASGNILTPYYPDTYWPNAFCSWTVTVAVNKTISLKLTNLPNNLLSTDCSSDYLDVYDGGDASSHLLGRFCANIGYKGIVRSTSNILYVTFRSDGLNEAGFVNASYSTNGETVLLYQWPTTLYVDGSCKSYLEVYDGKHAGSPLLGKFCGSKIPSVVRTTGPSMYIIFQSEGSSTGKGFNGTVQAYDCPSFYYGLDNCSSPCLCNSSNAVNCNNTDGRCTCRVGWSSSNCTVDIDECKNTSICTKTESCVNTPGSYRCVPDCDLWVTEQSGTIQTYGFPTYALAGAQCNWYITVAQPQTVVTLRYRNHFSRSTLIREINGD